MVLFLNDKKPTASYSQGQAFSFYYKKGQTKSVRMHSGLAPFCSGGTLAKRLSKSYTV